MVGKALAKDREERYQTARELQIDLRRLKGELELRAKLGGLPTLMRADAAKADARAPSTKGSGKGRSRGVAFVIALAAVVAAAVAASFFSYRAGLKNAPPPSFPTFRQLTFRRGSLSTARFAPDGNTLVYSAAFDGKPIELFTGRLERPESISLKAQVGGRTAGIQSISPQGEMALILDCEPMWGECHDGTLALMPLGGGAPREVMEDVYAADWSPDGKELAIVRASEGVYQLEYPKGHVLYKAPGRIATMRVSPKGDLVAFIDHPILDSGVGASVQVVDLNGNRRTLFKNGQGARGLAWSPSGEEVWFSVGDGGIIAIYAVTLSGRSRVVYRAPGSLLLYDISRDGRALVARGSRRSRMITVAAGSGEEHDLTWFDFSAAADLSADGKHVLFHEGDKMTDERDVQVFLRKADGSDDPVRLGDGRALALSPDGKWALALREGPPPQLVLLPTGPGEPRLLPRGRIKEYHYASFFPDGRRILFTGLADLGRPLRSYEQDIEGGEPRPVTEEGVIALWVSPDGKRFVGWGPGRGFGGEYYLFPFEGGAPVRIPGMEFGEVPARWSADGRALFVLEDADYESAIYRLDLRDGSRRLVKRIAPDPVGLVGLEINRPGSIQVTPDGKSYVYTYFILLQELFLVEGLK
jgi:Tol biopolymer transport system component